MFNGFRFGTAKNPFQMDGNGLKKKISASSKDLVHHPVATTIYIFANI